MEELLAVISHRHYLCRPGAVFPTQSRSMDDSHLRPRICGIRTSHHAAVSRKHLHQSSFYHSDHGNSGRLCIHAFCEGKNGGNLRLRLIDQGVNNDFEIKPTDSFVRSSVYWIPLYSACFGRL